MMYQMKNKLSHKIRRGGFTLIEVLVASTITLMVMGQVLGLFWISTVTIKDLYGPIRSRTSRSIAINEIRFRLSDARIGSAVVLDNNHKIRFVDPNLTTGGADVTSEMYFVPAERTLYYRENINSGNPVKIAKGPIDITFTLGTTDIDPSHVLRLGEDSTVTIFVRTSSDLSYSRVDTRDGETVVYLRNL